MSECSTIWVISSSLATDVFFTRSWAILCCISQCVTNSSPVSSISSLAHDLVLSSIVMNYFLFFVSSFLSVFVIQFFCVRYASSMYFCSSLSKDCFGAQAGIINVSVLAWVRLAIHSISWVVETVVGFWSFHPLLNDISALETTWCLLVQAPFDTPDF